MSIEIRIAGGMNAVGEKNGAIIVCGGHAVAVDWGQKIPEFGSAHEQNDMMDKLGRELPDEYFPDIDQLKGLDLGILCLTHGHQDHTEGWWKLRERNGNLAIAAHPFTGRVVDMRAEKNFVRSPDRILLAENLETGPFKIRRFDVNHSIPGASGFLIEAGDRRAVHLGDVKSWRIRGGVDKNREVFGPLLAEGPIDHLFLDATNATETGFVISEEAVGAKIEAELRKAHGRIFFTTISSNLRRMESAISVANKVGRPVIVIGSGMRDFLDLGDIPGWTSGYQSVLRDTLGNDTGRRQISPNPLEWPYNAVICVSGSQGEPLSFLDNWAEGRFSLPRMDADTLIVSQDTIPVPEIEKRVVRALAAISGKVDDIHLPEATPGFVSLGADVLRDPSWHASGHGMQGDLKLLLDIFRPRFFTPCHADRKKREVLAALGEMWSADWKCEAVLLDDGDRIII
jgi:ribonuclease J